jgi:hypothetical protein
VFWELFARNRQSEWAEEMAWAAARGAAAGDECDATCALDRISRTYARYWEAYPKGRWTSEAIALAARIATAGAQTGCLYSDYAAAHAVAERIRATLSGVAPGDARVLLTQLDETERSCRGGE